MAIPFWLTKLLVRTRLAGFTRRARRLTDGGAAYLKYYSDRVLSAPVDELLDPALIPHAARPGSTRSEPTDAGCATLAWRGERGADGFAARTRAARAGRGCRNCAALLRAAPALVGRTVDPDTDVIVTHGATAAYAAALDAFINPGDRIILFDPCSPLFALGAKSRHAKVQWVPTWLEDGRCRYIAANFERLMRGAKMLVLSDPGNPAGGCLANEDLEHIAWLAAGYGVLVYLDESFTAYRYGERPRCLAAMPGADRLTITAGSVSQEFGQPGIRVGWLAGTRHLVRACQLTTNLTAPYIPPMCQQAAARLLAEPPSLATMEQLGATRQYTLDRLRGDGSRTGDARRRVFRVGVGRRAGYGRARVRGTVAEGRSRAGRAGCRVRAERRGARAHQLRDRGRPLARRTEPDGRTRRTTQVARRAPKSEEPTEEGAEAAEGNGGAEARIQPGVGFCS